MKSGMNVLGSKGFFPETQRDLLHTHPSYLQNMHEVLVYEPKKMHSSA